ncbi:MAG: TIGR03067 domain-containing protein [Thermoguttaceae bacterium]|jgi:uncharacterized protein (TIGR03067 family)
MTVNIKAGTLSVLISVLLPACVAAVAGDATGDADALQGVWVAQSMVANGKPAPADDVKRVRFTFKGDKLLVKGNFADDREEACGWKIDPGKSPKHLDITPPKQEQDKPVAGIYEINGGELKICLRHGNSSDGRPTEFSSKPDSELVLMVFRKAKP